MKKIKRPIGRPRVNYNFEEARILIQNEQLASVMQYHRWHAINKPSRIPKRPDRAYKKEWNGWSDFLGSNNAFPCTRKQYRPFTEAKLFVHKLNIKCMSDWFTYAKSGKKPYDIPSRPDVVYRLRREWHTWRDFLGYDISTVHETAQSVSPIFYVLKTLSSPRNVYKLGILHGGKSNLIDNIKKHNLKYIAGFIVNNKFTLDEYMNIHVESYWNGDIDEYLVNNISELLFDISNAGYSKLT